MADKGAEVGEPRQLFWTADNLRNYLVASSRGEQFLLDRRDYPEFFSLGGEGNQSLNNLRDQTYVFEKWSTAGVNSNQRELKFRLIP